MKHYGGEGGDGMKSEALWIGQGELTVKHCGWGEGNGEGSTMDRERGIDSEAL